MYYPLTTMQRYFYDNQKKAPDSTMYNLWSALVLLHDWVDLERLANSIPKITEAHPAFYSLIEEHNGQPMQRIVPGLIAPPPIERITDAEFITLKDELIQPFYPGEAMCRFRIFQTESAKYLFIDTYHLICDGLSEYVLINAFDIAYAGQALPRDSWLLYLQEEEAAKFSPHYEESRRYFEDRYNPEGFSRYPQPDFDSEGLRQGVSVFQTGITAEELDILRKCHVTHNDFFITAALLATASFNHTPNVMHTWAYHGRNKKELRNIIGLLLKDLPVALSLEGMTIGQVFTSIREQVKGGLRHMDYPYELLNDKCLADDDLCIIYQGSLYCTFDDISLFDKFIKTSSKHDTCENIFDADIRDTYGKIELVFSYSADRYKPQTVEAYSDIFARTARSLLDAMRNNRLDDEVMRYV